MVGPISVGRVAWAGINGWSWLVAVVAVVVVAVSRVVLRAGCGVVLLVLGPPSVFTVMCSSIDLGIVCGAGLVLYTSTDQRVRGPNVDMREGASICKLLWGLLRSVGTSPNPLCFGQPGIFCETYVALTFEPEVPKLGENSAGNKRLSFNSVAVGLLGFPLLPIFIYETLRLAVTQKIIPRRVEGKMHVIGRVLFNTCCDLLVNAVGVCTCRSQTKTKNRVVCELSVSCCMLVMFVQGRETVEWGLECVTMYACVVVVVDDENVV